MVDRPLITVVDDDDSFMEALYELLRSYDYDVRLFRSAEALLASTNWLDSDCLLVDATLPGGGGLELQQKLRAWSVSIPIIFVTGYEDAEFKARVISEGALDCLCKPFEEEELLAGLSRALAAGQSPRS